MHQPAVEQTQAVELVDHDGAGPWRARDLLGNCLDVRQGAAQRGTERLQKAVRRRLHGAAIQADDAHARCAET